MAKTVGQLRKEGKSFKQISAIGKKEAPKAAAKLTPTRKSSGGRSRSPQLKAQIVDAKGNVVQQGTFSVRDVSGGRKVVVPNTKAAEDIRTKIAITRTKQGFSATGTQLSKDQQIRLSMSRGEIRPPARREATGFKEKTGRAILEFQEKLGREGREAKAKQKPISSFTKRAASDILGIITGTASLARTLSDATFRLPTDPKGKAARAKLKSATKLSTLAAAGVASGAAVGKDLQSSDAYENTRGLFSILTIFSGVPFTKANKVVSSANKVSNKVDLITGKAKTNVKTAGVLEDGTTFTQRSKYTFNPKTKKLTGTQKTIFQDGKIKVERIDFKDKGGFFEDTKGKRIEKAGIKPTETRISIKETTTKQKAKDNIRIFDGNTIKIGKRAVKVKETIIGLKGTKVTGAATKTRKVDIDFSKSLDKIDKGLDQTIAINKNFDAGSAFGKTKKQRQKIDSDIKSYLVRTSIKNKKVIVDRMELVFKNKQKPELIKRLQLKLKGDIAIAKVTKGKIKSIAEFEEIKPTFVSLGISKPKFKDGLLDLTQQKALTRVPDRITIPKLKIRIKGIKKIRGLGLIPAAISTLAIKNHQDKIKALDKKQETVPVKKQAPVKVPAKKKVQPQKKAQKKVTTTKKRTPTKQKTPQIKKPIRTRIPRIRIKEKAPIKLPLPGFNFDSKKLENRIATYQGIYRERKDVNKPAGKSNPVITKLKVVRDTRNRALSKLADLADNRAIRSIELRVIGLGNKKKDIKIPKVLRKFDKKKSKNTPVLKLVERSKFALDKKGETKELKRGKALKASPKKKTTKKVKVSTKKKKSTQKRSKTTKKKK